MTTFLWFFKRQMMGQTDDILEFYTYIRYTRNTSQLYLLITLQ